jgi:UDP-2,3-diacylglucosamine hydrolase
VLELEKIDYFVFGHRHLPMIYELNPHSKYINLGKDWIGYNSYAIFDGNTMELKTFEG